MSYDKYQNDWLAVSAVRAAKKPEVKKAPEMIDLRTDRNVLVARAQKLAAQGWIPHHETGERLQVASATEALILLEYGLWCKRLPAKPDFVEKMTEAEEAELTTYLNGEL
jgi:hypothetical protein